MAVCAGSWPELVDVALTSMYERAHFLRLLEATLLGEDEARVHMLKTSAPQQIWNGGTVAETLLESGARGIYPPVLFRLRVTDEILQDHHKHV